MKPIQEHLSDGDLVRFLDGELPDEERRDVSAHVSACAECGGRLDSLRQLGDALSGELADEAIPVDEVARQRALARVRQADEPRRRRATGGAHSRRQLAAAAIVVLVLGGFAVEPVRAWVADRLGFASPDAAEVPAPAERTERVRLSFEPTERIFRIELEHPQIAGTIELASGDSGLASAGIVGGSSETMLALPSGLLIDNEPGSTATYGIRLSSQTVDRVVVYVGGSTLAQASIDDFTDTPLSIELDGAAP